MISRLWPLKFDRELHLPAKNKDELCSRGIIRYATMLGPVMRYKNDMFVISAIARGGLLSRTLTCLRMRKAVQQARKRRRENAQRLNVGDAACRKSAGHPCALLESS